MSKVLSGNEQALIVELQDVINKYREFMTLSDIALIFGQATIALQKSVHAQQGRKQVRRM